MRFHPQTQASECGLACLAMIADAHGLRLDMPGLRRQFAVSLKGVTLKQLIAQAGALGFSARPLKLGLGDLSQLTCPCILHWDLNHFVVLKKVRSGRIVILDPAAGERGMALAEASPHFTGIALELSPNADFQPRDTAPRLQLAQLTGRLRGLPGTLARILVVALALQVFVLVAPLYGQLVIDEAVTSHDADLLVVLGLGFGLLLLVQTALGWARSWMLLWLGQTVSLQWRSNVFAHLVKLPPAFFEQRHLGDVMSRFGSIETIQRTVTNTAIEAALDGVLVIAAVALMGWYAPRLAAVSIAAVGLYALLRWAAYGALKAAQAERLMVAARESTYFLETIRALLPLKLFGREDARGARWQNLAVDVQNCDWRTGRMQIGFSNAQQLLFGLENLAVFWMGGRLVMDSGNAQGFTVGMLFAYVAYKQQFMQRVATLIDHVIDWRMLGLHAERLADIVLTPREDDSVPEHDLSHLPASLEVRGLSFRYGDGEPWVLRHVDFKAEAGQSVAVTGPSGCGKTTLLKLMLGLLEPTEGEVLYGGVPVRQLGLRNLRARIGTVMQEDVLLSGSLLENITCFDSATDVERAHLCAQLAQIHADIVRMPMGYQTLVGDLGSGLSGGQKQRLLLARALYKQPSVLALDEATSHLDIGNERAVAQALSAQAITRLIIAHRPETIAGAQRVVHVRDANVVELLREVGAASK
jgi:ATP-binding cassette, subfamily B, bacterial CvaB/MchF/RaxB